MAICYTGEESLSEKKITIEDLIREADPEDDFEIIAGESFDYRLVKLKIRFANRKIFKNKTLWFYLNNANDYSITTGDLDVSDKILRLKRAKGFRKTRIEPYIIYTNNIEEIRVLKSHLLKPVHAFALKYFFSVQRNFCERFTIVSYMDHNEETDEMTIKAKYLQKFINVTQNTAMKKEALQWIIPLIRDEKKPEEDE